MCKAYEDWIAEERNEAISETKKETAIKMIYDGCPKEMILRYSGVTEKQLEVIKENLKQ